jgi:hypothetical protein
VGCKPQREAPVELHSDVISYGLIGGYLEKTVVSRAKNCRAKGLVFYCNGHSRVINLWVCICVDVSESLKVIFLLRTGNMLLLPMKMEITEVAKVK